MSAPGADGITPVRHLTVEQEFDGQRIDNFLMRVLKGVPRSLIYRRLRRGEVRVNRGRVRQGYRVKAGDIIRVPPLRMADPTAVPGPSAALRRRLTDITLFEDERLLVINKPSGIAVHGGSGSATGLIEALRAMRQDLPYLELVHRLDKETSGCLVLAKRRSGLRLAHEALRERNVAKRYLALVAGQWPRAVRRVDAALRKSVLRSGERMVTAADDGKAARTDFDLLAASAVASLVRARPVTGRTHQIRVHAADEGHPIAGDAKYGDAHFNATIAALGVKRLFLHAEGLRARTLGLDVTAPLAPELSAVLETLGLQRALGKIERQRVTAKKSS